MSTVRQATLAREIIANAKRPPRQKKNKQELLVSSGYDVLTAAQNSKPTIESKGVQNELKKLGFSEEGARKTIETLMYDSKDESVKLRAASEVFKVLGSYAAEKSFNLTATASVDELKEAVIKDMKRFQGQDKP